jgi:hypothetical protein
MSSEHASVLPTEQLQNALACLDLSLESELALYRRQLSQAASALIALPPEEAAEGEPVEIAGEAAPPSQPEPELAVAEVTAVDVAEVTEAAPQEPEESTPSALVPFAESGPAEDEPEELPEPYNAELTAEPEAFERFLDPSIEDYLESSEALLKHLDDPQEKADLPNMPQAKSTWPLFLRAILGLLGVMAFAWFAITLVVQWLTPKPREVPQSPQLPQSLIQPLQSPATSGQGIGAGASAAQPLNLAPTAPSPLVAQQSAAGDKAAYYLVVVPYRGDASLQRARQAVPDAFIADVKGKRWIQLGLLDELAQAQQLVNDLKNQGFPSSVMAQKER